MHRQIAATALATTVDRILLRQSDTAHGGHDTGAYGSAGTFVAGTRDASGGGSSLPARSEGDCAALAGRTPAHARLRAMPSCAASGALSFASLPKRPRRSGKTLAASGNSAGTPRSVAFNVQGFRVAVNKGTGEIKILQERAGRRCRPGRQSDAVPRPGRRRRRAIARRDAVRGDGDRRRRAAWSIPNSATIICRRSPTFRAPKCFSPIPAIRLGPIGRQVDEREPVQPGRRRARQRDRRRHRHPLHATPFKPDRLFPALHEKFGS